MTRKALVLLVINYIIVLINAFAHQQPVAQKLWPEPCVIGSTILNDCNWCWCGNNQNYVCKARICDEVDLFGHFRDTIHMINVGMEGHGAWRSSATACQPLVQYERGDLLCICGEDGKWPNPVCRDIFRVLHEVDVSIRHKDITKHQCEASKLYLMKCNVCFCPSTGRIDPEMCTKRNCSNEPAIFHDVKKFERNRDEGSLEIYAQCMLERKYKFGCQSCICLKNNRLLCDKCDGNQTANDSSRSYCDNVAPDQVINIDCNSCLCDKKGLIYCTTRQCLGQATKFIDLSKLRDEGLISVDAPYDDLDCTPGTMYQKDCNTCVCGKTSTGQKYYSCTTNTCAKAKYPLSSLGYDCIDGTVYESNCQICRCNLINGVKRETCRIDSKCTGVKALKETRSIDINSLHGYCEPGHTYQKICNTCRCLIDGKTLMCTSNICDKTKEPITVDIVPINQKDGKPCPKDRMYKVDCNFCFCLANGNALCTTANCNKKN